MFSKCLNSSSKSSSFRLFTFKTTYQILKKLTINCSFVLSFSSFLIAIFFKSNFASKHWRLSLFTYRIDSKQAKTTWWTYRLLFVYIFSISNFLLEISINYRFNDFVFRDMTSNQNSKNVFIFFSVYYY